MGLRDYLSSREQAEQLAIREELMKALPILTKLRQRAIATLDDCHFHQQDERDGQLARSMEEEVQTLGALARETGLAVEHLRRAIATGDQLEEVEGRLRALAPPAAKP